MAATTACQICELLITGTCVNNQTCICFAGYTGVACQNQVIQKAQDDIGAIIASIFGGALLTIIIGLIVFFLWKRRSKIKKLSTTFSSTSSTTTTTAPSGNNTIVVPALYDLSLSQRNSNEPASLPPAPQTMNYHLYDELS